MTEDTEYPPNTPPELDLASNPYLIPNDIVNAWIELDKKTVINIPMTKDMIDNLFFAVNSSFFSLNEINLIFQVIYSGLNNENLLNNLVKSKLQLSNNYILTGGSHLRMFIGAIMEAAVKAEKND